jgi:DNA-binding MarR family transcriptional regulator
MSDDLQLLPEDAPIEDFLTYKIRLLYLLSGRRVTRYLAGRFDLSLIEWWLLGQLAVHAPSTVSDMVGLTMHDKAQVSRGLRSLHNRGYAVREEHPDDARSVFYNITNHGMDVYKEILPHRVAAQRDLLKVLGGEELQVVDRALKKLIEHLAKETQIT